MTKPKRRIMRRFKLDEISGVDVPAQEPALMTMFKSAPTKVVKGKKFFAVDFADVSNKRKPDTWKMRLTDKPGGEPVPELVDKAITAIDSVKESRREGVRLKLAKAWCKAHCTDMEDEELPEELKALTQEEVDDEEGMEDPNENEGRGRDRSGDMGAGDGEDGDGEDGEGKKPPFGAKPGADGKKPKDDDEEDDVTTKILKRYIDPAEGAKTFTEVLQCYEDDRRYSEAMEIAWPLVSALDTSLRSVVASKELDIAAKHAAMRSSVEMFLAKMRESMPEVEEELEKLFSEVAAQEGDGTMKTATAKAAGAGDDASLQEQVTALTAKMADLTKAAEDANKARDEALAKAATATAIAAMDDVEREFYGKCKTDADKEAFLKADKAGRKALVKAAFEADETVTVAGIVVNKAAAGALLPVILALQGENAKLSKQLGDATAKADQVAYEKRAEEELAHLPGTLAEKVEYLKAVDALPEAQRKVMKGFSEAANKTASAAFTTIGIGRGKTLEKDLGSAEGDAVAKGTDFMAKAREIRKRDEITLTEAMTKARQEHPDLYEEWRDAN